MRRLLVLSVLAFLGFASLTAGKQRNVQPYDGKSPRNGAMVYALPKVNVFVEIKATCTVNIPGPFAQYAERYLAATDAVMHRSSVWNFQKADVHSDLAVDSTRMYIITDETKQLTFAKENPFLMSVGEWGAKKPKKLDCHNKEHKEITTDTIFHTELLGEEALSSTSIPKMAERAAKQIFQLREARMAILSCDVAHQPDGVATREILHRIDSVERELTALFIGKHVTLTSKRSFAIDPTKKQMNLIIARISTLEGIKDADEMIGSPIYVDVNPEVLAAPQITKKEKNIKKGYYYNVPGSVTIKVRQGNDYTMTKDIVVPQNGYATWMRQDVMNILFTRIGAIEMIK